MNHRLDYCLDHPIVPVLIATIVCLLCADLRAQWTQFGGPNQSFRVDDPGVAREWPSEGPRRVWSRKLGPGFSSIIAEGDRLYTMYRTGNQEVVISLDAGTGETRWEYRYESTPVEGHLSEYGDGPNATPLFSEGRLYTIGVASVMHCLEAETGKKLWSHNLWRDFGGNTIVFGYSSSPIEYKNTVIVLVGGKEQSIVAFDKKDGRVVWKNLSFKNTFSTPRIMKICGEDQLVTFMTTEVIGADPLTGALKWQYPSVNEWKQNITMPILLDDDLLFASSYHAGTRGLRLVKGEPFRVEELWSTRKVEFFYTNAVRIGDYIYGTSGDQAASLMSAINARTGKIAWRKRGFAPANLVALGNRLIIVDEDGYVALATPTPDGLTVHSKVRLLTPRVRTAPTIVGHMLYLRDAKRMLALDLR